MDIDLVAIVREFDTAGLRLADILIGVGSLVTAATALVTILQKMVPLLERLAKFTATEHDDHAIDVIGRGIDFVAGGLRATGQLAERVSIIKRPTK